jgi:hypothetical protein
MEYIKQKLIPKENVIYTCVFAGLHTNNKFKFLKQTMENGFLSQSEFSEWFYRYQRIYHALLKFVSIIKYKYAKIVIDTDLCLNPIAINDKNVICIRQGSGRYLFLINDLIKIIHSSITNSQSFFAIPKSAKNPYTNIPFNKSTLYNIYFFVLFRTLYRPELLTTFFQYNFNLRRFTIWNEHILREYSISEYIEKTEITLLYDDIMEMLDSLNILNIDEDFPKETLVSIMKPYLQLWLIAAYSLIGGRQLYAARRFTRMLNEFVNYNPNFGRKMITREFRYDANGVRVVKIKVSFNDKHIAIKPTTQFLNSHME